MELLFIIGSFAVSILVTAFIKNKIIVRFCLVVAPLVSLVESIIIALKVTSAGIYNPWQFFSIDSLGAILLLIISSMGLATMVYSIAYLHQETVKGIIGLTRVKQYFFLLNFFLVAMFLAITASSPIFTWISIEVTTLSTAFLISFYNKPSSIEAAWKYLIMSSIGLLLGFFGTLLYFTSVSSLGGNVFVDWQLLLANTAHLDPMLAKVAFVFILIGYGTKVGFVPMHTWKPDAYSNTPAPLGALLSGALLPIAFFVILKFKILTDAVVGVSFSQNLLITFGLLSIAVAALIMFNSKNYKRLLAYSSIENAGVIALGFGFGGLGIFAAILHLIYHSCVKAILFFSAGNLLLKYNSAKIINVKGALNIIPLTSILFIAGFLVVTGTPPFGIFLTKMFILSAGMQNHPILVLVALFFMTIVFIGFLKHVTAMFFGEKPADIKVGEINAWLIIPPVIFLLIVVVLSFYIPPFLYTLINNAALRY